MMEKKSSDFAILGSQIKTMECQKRRLVLGLYIWAGNVSMEWTTTNWPIWTVTHDDPLFVTMTHNSYYYIYRH